MGLVHEISEIESLRVEIIEHSLPAWRTNWQKFVDSQPKIFVHQLAIWHDVLKDAFNVSPVYLQATEKREIKGILPLYFSNSLLMQPHISSLYGGCLAMDSSVAALLINDAKRILNEMGGRYLLIRGGYHSVINAKQQNNKVTLILNLTKDKELLLKNLNKKTRWAIRKSEKDGFHADFVFVDEDILNKFWKIYAINVHRLGTPVMSKNYFYVMLRHFGDQIRLMILYKDNKIVGGMLCIAYRKTLYNLYAAVLPHYQNTHGNYQLYWSAISAAREDGFDYFDFGFSSQGSGSHHFKRKWRGEEEELISTVYWCNGNIDTYAIFDNNLVTGLWRRLPLVICNTVGPIIRRQIPIG